MDRYPEITPNETNPFDLERLDQDDIGAPGQAMADEYGRIALLAPRLLPLLGKDYIPSDTGNAREDLQRELDLAAELEDKAITWSASQQLAPLLVPKNGLDARKRVFLNIFYGLSRTAPADDLIATIESRQSYMAILRLANDYGITLSEYQARQQAIEQDQASVEAATDADRAAFTQLLLLQQQYQDGNRRG